MSDPRDAPVSDPLGGTPDPEAPILLAQLLSEEERELLGAAWVELRCPVALVDGQGRLLQGPAPPAELLTLEPEGEPLRATVGGRLYLCTGVFYDCNLLARVLVGPVAPADEPTARFLCRLADQLLYGALRRTLSNRMHLMSVQDAYCDLQLKNQRLEQALQRMHDLDRVKASFLATVSHELRTPLTSVIGYSEMLMEGLAGPLNDEQREYLGTVIAKGDQLLHLITGLLNISRIEASGVQLTVAPLDLCEVARDVSRTVTPHARRRQLTLSLRLPDAPLQIRGDRDKLRQVILNLVSNAIKFTPEHGEVTLSAAAHVSSDTAEVLLSVRDTGIGIPGHLIEKIFEPFYQVDSSHTREYEGTGLGLSIVRRFVDAHGGRVWVEATADAPRGSTFYVVLPLEPPLPAHGPRSLSYPPPPPGTPRS